MKLSRSPARYFGAIAKAMPLSATVLVCVAALAPGLGVAAAPAPVTITSPANESWTNNQVPRITVTSSLPEERLDPLVIRIYEGTAPGREIESFEDQTPPAIWSVQPRGPLAQGTYTARAEEELDPSKNSEVTFTVDTTPPQVALNSPANGSSTGQSPQLVAGTAGTAPGDLPGVAIRVYQGPTIGGQAPLESLEVQAASDGSFSASLGGLTPGTYSVRAEQSDQAGNIGRSAPVAFNVTGPPPGTAPVASFTWFPAYPKVGETVSLVSSSTDSVSPITALAWSLSPTAPFSAGGPVFSTSFSTPGPHVVRLRVSDASGQTAIASQTIQVSSPPLSPMLPFPIVRMAGRKTAAGVNVSLLSVLAPVQARVTVTCRGRCHRRSVSRIATASGNSKPRTVLLVFPRFERAYRAGAVLELRITLPGQIGKYTRFAIHRRILPTRTDACLASTDPRPVSCPS